MLVRLMRTVIILEPQGYALRIFGHRKEMGSISANSFTSSQLGALSSVSRWNLFSEVRMRDLMKFQAHWSVHKLYVAGGNLGESWMKVRALSGSEGYGAPEKLQPLWDDGYGSQSLKDYVEIAKEMISSDDDGPPRWFCPTECGAPLKDSPLLLYLPGLDGLGFGLILHHKALGKVFEVRCMHTPVKDRTPFEGLVSFVEDAVRLENASSSKKKPIYLIGDSLGACIALSVAARNPAIDLVLILVNPATSYSRSKLQYLLPLLKVSPDELHIFMPYLYVLNSGNPIIMAVANTTGTSSVERMKQVFSKLIEFLPQLSRFSDIIPKDTLLWKLMLLKSAAAYANSRLHAVTAEVLVLASGKDNCKVRYFRDSEHSILLENGVNLLTIIKGTCLYRQESRRYDYATDFIPPSKSEFKQLLDRNGIYRCLTSSAMFSTLADGKIVRGLSGVPSEGPVILVGYHMLHGLELLPIVDEFLRTRNIIVRGIAHPFLFSKTADWISEEFFMKDFVKLFGGAPVSATNLFKLFKTKSHVLMYPGGAREALHRKGEAYKLFWPDQPEFVRIAAKFGATIVPFGVAGEDDLTEFVFDNNDLMKIPVLNGLIRQNGGGRVNVATDIAKQDLFICLLPKIPGRLYYLFGKPIQTKGREEMLQDRHKARELYLEIKSEVEKSIDYLLIKREEDPYRRLFDRTVYRAFSAHVDHVPSFDP